MANQSEKRPLLANPGPANVEDPERSSSEYGSVVVVGNQYCLPYQTELVMTQRLLSPTDGDYLITDADGNTISTVKGVSWSLRGRRVLYDASGMPILTTLCQMWSLHGRHEVFRGDTTAEDKAVRLFRTKLSSVMQLKTKMEVFLDSNADENNPDFKIVGDFLNRKFDIYHCPSNAIVAEMHTLMNVKDLLHGKDSFGVTVYPNVDYAFIVSLIVVLNDIHTQQTRSAIIRNNA